MDTILEKLEVLIDDIERDESLTKEEILLALNILKSRLSCSSIGNNFAYAFSLIDLSSDIVLINNSLAGFSFAFACQFRFFPEPGQY